MPAEPTSQRDPTAVADFVERFGATMSEAGIPRMPSRVFAALMCADSGRLTAAELSEQLLVSPAAVSGAVRYLSRVGLVSREREPGSRRDQYRVYADIWYEALLHRDHTLLHWQHSMDEGIEVLGADTPAGERMAESRDFFAFTLQQLPDMLARWREYRDRHRALRTRAHESGEHNTAET